MSLIKKYQKIKWQILAKLNPNYYVFSEKDVSENDEKYRESGRYDVKRFVIEDELLKDLLEDAKLKTCLEFGCGNGRMTQFLAQIFGSVYALDISSDMIKSAKKRLKDIKNIAYLVERNDNRIDLSDNSIDFIFSYIVLQHLPSREMVEAALSEFYRIIKPNGVVKIQVRGVPAYGGYLRYFKWYYGVSFSENEIKNILKSIGFEILKSEGQNTKLFWLTLKKK